MASTCRLGNTATTSAGSTRRRRTHSPGQGGMALTQKLGGQRRLAPCRLAALIAMSLKPMLQSKSVAMDDLSA